MCHIVGAIPPYRPGVAYFFPNSVISSSSQGVTRFIAQLCRSKRIFSLWRKCIKQNAIITVMNDQSNCEEPSYADMEALTMGWIQSTDILLGRGPKCYNNTGNRVLRKLIKEHAVHLKNEARRGEMAALVKQMVSKLVAMGCRFLYRSSTGIWVEAPSHLAEKKVGHGLRDARLSVSRKGHHNNALPKYFSPSYRDHKHKNQVMLALTGEENSTEDTGNKKSDKTEVMISGVDPQCEPHQTMLHISLKHEVTSSTVRATHRMKGVLAAKLFKRGCGISSMLTCQISLQVVTPGLGTAGTHSCRRRMGESEIRCRWL